MTIAKRLMILVAAPLLILFGLGVLTTVRLNEIESRSRFVADTQIESLACLGNISRSFTEMRVNVRTCLLADTKEDMARSRALFDTDKADVKAELSHYADKLVTGDKDRRLLDEFRDLSARWIAGAEEAMTLTSNGRQAEGESLLFAGPMTLIADRLSAVSKEWIKHNEALAMEAGKGAIDSIGDSRRGMWVAGGLGLVITGLLGVLAFRRIVGPIQALETSVTTIAGGDYTKPVPCLNDVDEMGGLARSINVLKSGAAAMDDQRWIKAHAAAIAGGLQGAGTLEEFGQRLLSALVPLLGGGVAGFYLFDERSASVRRIAGYGLSEEDGSSCTFRLGEGLAGQCAVDRKPIALTKLPLDYLRVTSGVGGAAPTHAGVWPLVSGQSLLAVLEVASFVEPGPRERSMLEDLLPTVAMSLEVLQRNLRTGELLEQTKRQAETLSHTNFLSDSALDLTKAGYWHVPLDDSGWYISSERASRIFGDLPSEGHRYRLDEWAANVRAGDEAAAKHTMENFAAAVAGTIPVYDAVYAYKRPIDGRVVWIHAMGHVVKDATGKPTVMYGVTQDITAFKLAEDEIKASEQRVRETEKYFRSVLELAPDGLMVVGADGVIALANAQCEKLFGYSREELIGQKVEMLVPSEIRGHHPKLREDYHRDPTVRAMGTSRELRAVRKDGSTFAAEIGLSPLPARPGAGASVAVSIRDVTVRKEQEDALKQAMTKAEEATKAKSAFLANMSHEIRTPMNGIMGMTELALDTDLTAEQRDYLVTVKSSADALLSLINDILDFSKIEAGRIELDPIEFLLRDSVSDMLNPLALRAGSKGLELAYDVHPDVPDALIGDVYRLRQVVVNLVGNAIKFTQKGEVVVGVNLLERKGDELLLEVAVRDTGIGISPEAAARLFKPFEQADAATTRKYGGTGLGLAISRQLVQLMGGEIRLESTAGVGSSFIFTVRFKAGIPREMASADDAARLFKDKTALIVDDNETNRRILTVMLSQWGLKSIQADSGSSALTTLDRTVNAGQPVSVLISDLHMPGMDGFELIEAVRARPYGADLPVLLLTSSASPGDQDHGVRLRVAARLLKPAKQSLLLDNLVRVLSGANRIDKPRASAATAPTGLGGAPATLTALNVLLAEDNPVNQKFAVRVLEGAGHTVTVAQNGREAVDKSGAGGFDLVLMDLQMPEMDGLEATRAIREREAGVGASGGRLPIIAMTANAMAGDREMCLGAGMDGYVAKPVKKDMLFAEIGRVLGIMGKGAGNGTSV